MMKKIVLISCSKTQKPGIHKARDLYIGSGFKKCLAFATEIVRADRIYILSTKHCLLDLDTEIANYDAPFPQGAERGVWEKRVLGQLRTVCDLDQDNFILLPPASYIEYIGTYMKHKEIPMMGLRQGERLAWLNQHMYKKIN
jgi:hypothetical protein